MFYNSINIEQLLLKNFSIFSTKQLSSQLTKEYIFNYPDNLMFINNDENNYYVALPKVDQKLSFLPVLTIKQNSNFKDIIHLLKDHFVLLVENNSGEICGYLDSRYCLQQINKRFKFLDAFTHGILETVNESCTAIDRNKRVLFWTKEAENLFSVKADQIVGKKITDFFEHGYLEILNALEKGTSVKNQKHHARDDLIVMINSSPVHIDDEIIGAVVSETDITNMIRLNDELYEASKRLYDLEKEVNNTNHDPFKDILGNSPKIKKTMKLLKRASLTEANILIYGESGVGKELFAKAMHNLRESSSSPFIPINCGAIPDSLFESEIFGYEKGAFSGADQKGKAGKVELAQNGTLFLDEIGEMPLDMQVKLLRLLQEKKFYRVGGTEEVTVSFRVIAATNKNLKELVDQGKFREDLYYRLNVVEMEIPPLRKRPEDIIELSHYFLHEYSVKYNRPIHGISQQVMQALLQHDWPGNIRELKNVIERLVVFSENEELRIKDLPFQTPFKDESLTNDYTFDLLDSNLNLTLKEQLERHERKILIRELEKSKGNKKECAKNLGVTRATLYNRMNRLNIDF